MGTFVWGNSPAQRTIPKNTINTMELEELKKLANAHIADVEKRLSDIETITRKLHKWKHLRGAVSAHTQQTDEAILKEMTKLFGEDCLKALIREVAGDYIKSFDDAISAHSCDLKMFVKSHNQTA